jgi:hypothetical protein
MINYFKYLTSLLDFTEDMNNRAFLWLLVRVVILVFIGMLFVTPVLIVLILDPFTAVYTFTFIITCAVIIFMIKTHNIAEKWYLGLLLVSPTILLFVGILVFLRVF